VGCALTNALARRAGFVRRRGKSGLRSRDVYAALDLGTNNCRLLIARPAASGFRVIDAFSRIVRLGEGLAQTACLSEAAMSRAIDALRICARKMERRRVTSGRAVATEACRRARNGDVFAERVRRETGLELEIISNSEEATLGLYGCTPLLDPAVPNALIFDIGGGSTEVSWLAQDGPGPGQTAAPCAQAGPLPCAQAGPLPGARGAPALVDWCSLPLGVVTLAEHYGGLEVTRDTYAAMVAEVAAALRPFDEQHALVALVRQGSVQMLGTSGTVTTLSGIGMKLAHYDRTRVDGSYLDFASVTGLSRQIAAMSYDERVAHPCIGRQRADLVVAGCAILEAICRTWPVGRLRVADRGLREGILCTLMQRAGPMPGPCALERGALEDDPPGHAMPGHDGMEPGEGA